MDVIEGGQGYEEELHKRFYKDHERGEWYRFTSAITNFIREANLNEHTSPSSRKAIDISKMTRDEILQYMVDIEMVTA